VHPRYMPFEQLYAFLLAHTPLLGYQQKINQQQGNYKVPLMSCYIIDAQRMQPWWACMYSLTS
jgi:hypothetical protein